MHENTDVVQYGIDFETFHRCTEDLSGEDEVLARKIFDKINSGTSGILSLEDYVDALNTMNRNNIIDQIEFFLKIFNCDLTNHRNQLASLTYSKQRMLIFMYHKPT
jgi:hypothetical protein